MAYKLVSFGNLDFPAAPYPRGTNGYRLGTARVQETVVQVVGGYFDRQPSLYRPRPQKQQIVHDFWIQGSTPSALTAAYDLWLARVGQKTTLVREGNGGNQQSITARLIELSPLPVSGGNYQQIRAVFDTHAPSWLSTTNETVSEGTYASNGERVIYGDPGGPAECYDATFSYTMNSNPLADISIEVTIDSGGLISNFLLDGSLTDVVGSTGTLTVANGEPVTIGNYNAWPGFSFGANHNHPYLILLRQSIQFSVTVNDTSGGGFRDFSLAWNAAYN